MVQILKSGGIIMGGRVLHGMDGMAAELGHLTVDPFGPPCGCGNLGCLEKIASATAVESMAVLMSLSAGPLTSKEVCQLAIEGNVKAQAIFAHGWGFPLCRRPAAPTARELDHGTPPTNLTSHTKLHFDK